MVVVEQQDQIEVFVNQNGAVTIKQTDTVGEESIVFVTPRNVEDLILGLQNALADLQKGGNA